MIGYYTDNSISQGVMRAFQDSGMRTEHIRNFKYGFKSVFYGILRGTGTAMRWCEAEGRDYWYLDNGYFDAVYMDNNKVKDMSGKYRVVKNDMIEPFTGKPISTLTAGEMNVLLLPPSPYSAFMYDTTPEDWLQEWVGKCKSLGYGVKVRDKELGQSPLEDQLLNFDAVVAFNSMGIMKAVEVGAGAYTTHGVIRNSHMFGKQVPFYGIQDMKAFYEPKQFTLDEIREKGTLCLQ